MHTTVVRRAWTSDLMILRATVFTALPLVQSRSSILLLWIQWFFWLFKSKNWPHEIPDSTIPVKIPRLKIRQVAVYEILHLRPQLIKQMIQTLLENNSLDMWNHNLAVSIILDLIFPFYTGRPKFWLSLHFYLPTEYLNYSKSTTDSRIVSIMKWR